MSKEKKMPEPLKITEIYFGDRLIATAKLYDPDELDAYLGIKKRRKKWWKKYSGKE